MWKRSSVSLCIAALTIVSMFAGAGTYAYYSGEKFTLNFFSPETIEPVISGLNPGETDYIVINVPNNKNFRITAKMRLLNVLCEENGVVEPEQEWYTTHGQEKNDIDTVITFGLWIDRDDDTSSCNTAAGDQWIIDEAEGSHIDDIVGIYHVLGIINSGEILTVVTSYHMDEETENWAQSDTMTFDIEITREQVPPVPPPPPQNKKPKADAGPNQKAWVGRTVHFDGTGSHDPDGVIVGWRWSFGDGATASGETASHAYSEPGHYRVTLTVWDNMGAEDSDTCMVKVSEEAFKSIIHHGGVFHVLDGDVRYEFHMAAEGDVEEK
jgi:hypothetical protein